MDQRVFLSFEDYFKDDQDPKGWITVTRFNSRSDDDSRYTFSALASLNAKNAILNRREFEINPFHFGIPTFERSNNDVTFTTSQKYNANQILFEPFVIRREFHGLYADTFDVVQNFILYHNLFFDHDRNVYSNIIEEEEVIKYVEPTHVRVKEKYLCDYLAARKMILVRYHDHRRQNEISVLDTFGKERNEFDRTARNYRYHMVIGPYGENNNAFSMLVGKDIILPYLEPKHQDYFSVSGKPHSYEKYSYKIGDDGNEVEESCDKESKESTGHFLTPIFFKKEVLDKYYNKPRFYKIEDGEICCLDLWSISFGESDDGLIHVWLGDLGRIPYNEQKYWKTYNVVPGSCLSKNFVRRQLLSEFTDNEDPCERLLDLRTKINIIFVNRFNVKLFNDLPETRKQFLDIFHTLTHNEETEFDKQILIMAKIFIDTINKKDLEKLIDWEPNPNENKSLNVLEHFLNEKLESAHHAKTIVCAFRMVQTFRSATGAHLPGTKYDQALQRFALVEHDPKTRFVKILDEFYNRLDFLNQILSAE